MFLKKKNKLRRWKLKQSGCTLATDKKHLEVEAEIYTEQVSQKGEYFHAIDGHVFSWGWFMHQFLRNPIFYQEKKLDLIVISWDYD